VPDRIVVQELGMALQVKNRGFPRSVVQGRIERDAVPGGDA
jgi:hypothetical protein